MAKVFYTFVDSPEHTLSDHPENHTRFSRFNELQRGSLADYLEWIEPEQASLEAVAAVHSPELIKFLADTCKKLLPNQSATIDPAPTYVTTGSWLAALLAAGSTLAVTRAVLSHKMQAGFALVRPPGHHASRDYSQGFCLLNNLAIALSNSLVDDRIGKFHRAAIVDFDAHHGNGTEAIFWDYDEVGFFSFHQERIYPGSGALSEAPHARGRILNLPLPADSGDQALEQIAQMAIRPWLERYKPEVIFVSAGFDGHWSDPLTSLGFSTGGFYHLARFLLDLAGELCQGRIVFVLEGGYHPEALEDNVTAVLSALSTCNDFRDTQGPSPHPEPDIQRRLAQLSSLHAFAQTIT